MIAGLINNEHQTRVLAQAAVLVTLQQKFDLLVSLETTDKSTSKLQPPPTAPPAQAPPSQSNPQKSDYQRKKALPKTEIRPCTGCGKTSHPGKTLRRKDCPAFANTCKICSKKGHFDDVCRKRGETDSAPSSSQSSMQAADTQPTSSIFSQTSIPSSERKTLKNRRLRQRLAAMKRSKRNAIENREQLQFMRGVRHDSNRRSRG